MNKYILAVIAIIGIVVGLTIISSKVDSLNAQFKPCVWPNTCGAKSVTVAQFQPCVWPNRCAKSIG